MLQVGKVLFGTGSGRKAFFDLFCLTLDPRGTYASTAKKRQIRWYRPFFPLAMQHGLSRKRGGDWYWYTFFFSPCCRG